MEDVTVPAEPSDAERMPPPPTSRILWPSVPGDSEPIPHKRAMYGFIKDFVFAFGLWCIQTNLTRQQYSNLLEVLKLLTDMSDIQRLVAYEYRNAEEVRYSTATITTTEETPGRCNTRKASYQSRFGKIRWPELSTNGLGLLV